MKGAIAMIAFPEPLGAGMSKEYIDSYNGTMAALEDFCKKHAPLSRFEYSMQKSYFAQEYPFMGEVEKIAHKRGKPWDIALEIYQSENKVEINPVVKEKFLQDMTPRRNYR